MNNFDIQTNASSITDVHTGSNPLASLVRGWVNAFVAQYETAARIDPAARLRWTPVA
jgi:hypothetical protein